MKHTRATFAAVLTLLLQAAGQAGAQTDAATPAYVVDCDAAHAYSVRMRGVALLVVGDGRIVCERYARGAETEDAWELASGVKSFAAVMAAAAVQDGLIGLDEPVAAAILEWRGDPAREAVTIRHLLSQSSGLAVNPGARRLPGYADALEGRMEHPAGTRFAYGAEHFAVFGEVLRRRLSEAGLDATPAHYFIRRILAPIGAEVAGWQAVDGMPVLSEGASMTPRNWARFGWLVLQGGRLDDTPLADPGAMAAMFQPGQANPGYGLGWWLLGPQAREGFAHRAWPRWAGEGAGREAYPRVYMAAGAGGQRLYLFPELGLVVVRMTRGVSEDPATRSEDWSDRRFLQALIRTGG